MKIKDCAPGQRYTGYLAVKDCAVREANNNTQYLALVLTDGETEIMGRVWQHTGDPPGKNTIIHATAVIGEYNGKPQATIAHWQLARPGEYNPQDFLPVCPVDREELKARLRQHIAGVKDPGLSQLLFAIFRENKELSKAFPAAPAAIFHHHAYLGGLLHHTVGVVDQCQRLATPDTDTDLLTTGAILHDIGKTLDYDWSGCVFTMTDNGILLGHIVQGIMLINGHAHNCPDLSPSRLSLLLHLIASHHGQLDWGSPVEPACLEAVLLHNADMLDMQLFKLSQARSKISDGENWTDRVPGMNRRFYVGR